QDMGRPGGTWPPGAKLASEPIQAEPTRRRRRLFGRRLAMRLDELAVYERGLEERAEWVEHRLHRGALELDERAAALERTARKLESEATRLTELGAELSQREAELGELAAAFNERGARLSAAEAEVLQREERLAGREARVVRLVRRIAERRARVSAAVRAAPPAVAPEPE